MKVPNFVLVLLVCLIFTVPPLTILLLRAFQVHITDDLVRNVLERYDDVLSFCLNWIEPYLAPLLDEISRYVDFRLELQPHWKYVFQLMFVYFSADAKISWSTGRPLNAIVLGISGTVIALVVSVSAGLFDPAISKITSSFIIGTAPIVGYTAYALIAAVTSGLLSRERHAADAGMPVQKFGEFVSSRAKRAVLTMAIGLSILTTGIALLNAASPSLGNPGLVMLIILVFLLGANWVSRGLFQVRRKFAHAGGPSVSDIWNMANVQLGAGMMGTIAGAFAEVALLWVAGSLG